MNFNDVEDIKKALAIMQENISSKINQKSGFTKVIIIGITGSGKSSLACSLSNKKPLIKSGKKVELVGPGIMSGLQSVTRIPEIIIDETSNIIFCDCPGFDDTNGTKQEIINSFIIDYLFDFTNNGNIKILLVISSSEFDTGRGQGISKTFNRISNMFPNPKEIETDIGLVITKGEIEITNVDFIEQLESTNSWATFFKTHADQAFVFPQALRSDIGKQYDFADHQMLISFLKIHHPFSNNLIHKTVLSENAALYLKNVHLSILKDIKQTIKEIFLLLSENYKDESDILKVKVWIGMMTNLKQRTFCNCEEFKNLIKENGIYNYCYQIQFKKLSDTENISKFIDKVFLENKSKLILNQEVSASANESINELDCILRRVEQLYEQRKKEEQIREMVENQRKIEEERKKQEEEIQNQIKQQQLLQEQQRLQEEQLRKQAEEQQRQIEELQRKRMQSQLEVRERNRLLTCTNNRPHNFGSGYVCQNCYKPKCECGYNHNIGPHNHCNYCHKPMCHCGYPHKIQRNRCIYCHCFKCSCGYPHEWGKKMCKLCLMSYNDYLKSQKK